MKQPIFTIPLLLLSMLLIFISGCFNNTNNSNEPTLTVGIASGYAPFISLNEQGVYEGFDIDVITAIAEKMHRKLKLVDLGSMSSLFMALNQESVDALIWGLSVTKERCSKVAMINYQGTTVTSYPLLFWQAIPDSVQSIDDMQGMTICVEPNSAQEAALNEYPGIDKRNTEKVDDALLSIQYGKADAALVEPAIAQKFKKRFPEINILDMQLSLEQQEQGIGIAVRKNNNTLINEITQAINALKQEDYIATLEQKWGIV